MTADDRPDGAEAARRGFAAQSLMATFGAELVEAGKGATRIAYRRNDAFCQQNGFLHAGVATAIADTACGFAARTEETQVRSLLERTATRDHSPRVRDYASRLLRDQA